MEQQKRKMPMLTVRYNAIHTATYIAAFHTLTQGFYQLRQLPNEVPLNLTFIAYMSGDAKAEIAHIIYTKRVFNTTEIKTRINNIILIDESYKDKKKIEEIQKPLKILKDLKCIKDYHLFDKFEKASNFISETYGKNSQEIFTVFSINSEYTQVYPEMNKINNQYKQMLEKIMSKNPLMAEFQTFQYYGTEDVYEILKQPIPTSSLV
jgi:hypothetical protein